MKLIILNIVKLLQNLEYLLINCLLSLLGITILYMPFNESICKHCDFNEVGNEQHYVMQCSNSMFKEIRFSFI